MVRSEGDSLSADQPQSSLLAEVMVEPWTTRRIGPPQRQVRALWRFAREQPLGAISALLIAMLTLTAVFAPVIAPYSATARAGEALIGPSSSHWMGTDNFGRDEFSRIILGSRSAMTVGLGVAAIGTLGALITGLVSGYFGGVVDLVIQRLVDGIMALPSIVVVLGVLSFVGGGELSVTLLLGLLFAPSSSRIIRGAVMTVANATYVEAARAMGTPMSRILLRHVLPNVFAPAMVVATLAVGNAILAVAALSFLGFGITPPTPSWGGMLSAEGQSYMEVAPWLAIFPGIAISITVFSFNMFGDALRDVLDPRLRGT